MVLQVLPGITDVKSLNWKSISTFPLIPLTAPVLVACHITGFWYAGFAE